MTPTRAINYAPGEPMRYNTFCPGFWHEDAAYYWSNIHLGTMEEAVTEAQHLIDLCDEADLLTHAQRRYTAPKPHWTWRHR